MTYEIFIKTRTISLVSSFRFPSFYFLYYLIFLKKKKKFLFQKQQSYSHFLKKIKHPDRELTKGVQLFSCHQTLQMTTLAQNVPRTYARL